ncbi:MAG: metallophosphoesterase [Armatimonadetes bacterium]|nr:metallophosphoesterase [Armatimonadota bacterium]
MVAAHPRWSFCAFHDTHLGGAGTGVWNNRMLLDEALPLTRALAERIGSEGHAFALLLGDVTERGDQPGFQALAEALAPLPFPVYPAVGNHDAVHPESRAWLRTALQPPGPSQGLIYYDFVHQGLYFALLDCVWQLPDGSREPDYKPTRAGQGMAVPDDLIDWLDAGLRQHATLPAVVCLHFPLLPVRDSKQARGAKDAGPLGNRDDLLAVLDRHPNVRAVLAAHMHLAQVERRRDVVHATGAALVEWPHVYRRFDVFADRVRVTTHTVADEATRVRSLIPGHEWAAGDADEQAFEILLGFSKQ